MGLVRGCWVRLKLVQSGRVGGKGFAMRMLVQLKLVQSGKEGGKGFPMRLLVQLKVVQSSSLRKRVRYGNVGSAKRIHSVR